MLPLGPQEERWPAAPSLELATPLEPWRDPASEKSGGWYLNMRLQTHLLRLGLDICGLEEDDLFNFKNKYSVDQLALPFQ